MTRRDFLTPLGILLGFGLIFIAIYVAGGREGIMGFISISSFVTVIGGIFASILVSFGAAEVRNMMKVIKKTFKRSETDIQELIDFFVELSRKSLDRNVALLDLEYEKNKIRDPFIKKGVSLIVDNYHPDLIKNIMEFEIAALEKRHLRGYQLIQKAADLAPAWGMIGTVIGLVLMLQQLTNPSALGPGIALALLTTLYGILTANLVLNPIANKLQLLSEDEIFKKQIIVEALVSIQNRQSPSVIREKLQAFLSEELYDVLLELESREGEEIKNEPSFEQKKRKAKG